MPRARRGGTYPASANPSRFRLRLGDNVRMDYSVDSLAYQAIQIVFRRAIIELVRERLSAEYPDSWLEKVRASFKLAEWESARASAQAAQALGHVDRVPRDDLDLLGVNNFYGLFEKFFLVLVPPEELPQKEFVSKLRQNVLGWFREVKGVRDPISHPLSEELPLPDALRAIDSTVRITRKLHLIDANNQLLELFNDLLSRATRMDAENATSVRLDDTLPARESIVGDFVGREDELADLWRWMTDDSSFRWLLSGDGGKGKSAIAYKFASDVCLAAPSGLAGVFWLSAKRRRFDEGDIVEIASPDFWDLDSALNKILTDYGWASEIGASTETKRATALQLFEELPCLLVVDDLDTIPPDQDDVVEFMTHDVPTRRTKVLLTSRRQFIGMGRSCSVVSGLVGLAAREFLRSRARLMAIPDEVLTEHRCTEIANVCDGSPLYMEDLLRLCKFLPIDEALETWKSKNGDTVREYAMEREIELLSSGARQVLSVCSLAQVPLAVEELVRITGKNLDNTVLAIDELLRMYLVPAAQLIEGVPRFAVNRNVATLVRTSMEDDPARHALTNAITSVLGAGVSPGQTGAVGDYIRQARALSQGGRHNEAEQTLDAALGAFPNNARVLALLGSVYSRFRPSRSTDARRVWGRAYELGYSERSMYLQWGNMELRVEQWQRAAEAAEFGLERVSAKDPALLQMAGYARSRLGQALLASFNDERARTELAEADRLLNGATKAVLEGRVSDYDAARAFRSWVINARFRQDQKALCDRLAKWLTFNPKDEIALQEARRQGGRCPKVAALLQSIVANEQVDQA